jgi:hypothetical protein
MARFCNGCGTEFTADPEVTRAEPAADQTDPFASWYQREGPESGQGTDTNWQPTQTVQGRPDPAAGDPPSPYPPSPPFPPGPPPTPANRGNGGKGLFIAVAVVVVLAAGGGAYALAASLGKHPSAQPPPQPSSSATSGSSPQTPTPSAAPSLVAIAPGVTANAEPQVETVLSHYFHGINTHNYSEYASTLNAAELAAQPPSKFESGYSSTTDSGMTLTNLSGNGNGGLTATVSFTSHQSPAHSVDNSSCNAWTLNFYLVPDGTGNGYLIGPQPSGYRPTYSDC